MSVITLSTTVFHLLAHPIHDYSSRSTARSNTSESKQK